MMLAGFLLQNPLSKRGRDLMSWAFLFGGSQVHPKHQELEGCVVWSHTRPPGSAGLSSRS